MNKLLTQLSGLLILFASSLGIALADSKLDYKFSGEKCKNKLSFVIYNVSSSDLTLVGIDGNNVLGLNSGQNIPSNHQMKLSVDLGSDSKEKEGVYSFRTNKTKVIYLDDGLRIKVYVKQGKPRGHIAAITAAEKTSNEYCKVMLDVKTNDPDISDSISRDGYAFTIKLK